MLPSREAVESPKNSIPTLMRVEPADDSRDLRRELAAPFGYGVFQMNGVVPEGKIYSAEGDPGPEGEEGAANDLVEGVTDILDGVRCDGGDRIREILGESYLKEIQSRLWLRLYKLGIRLIVDERLAALIKFRAVFPRAVDKGARAFEQVR
jgi:hypothetical protein